VVARVFPEKSSGDLLVNRQLASNPSTEHCPPCMGLKREGSSVDHGNARLAGQKVEGRGRYRHVPAHGANSLPVSSLFPSTCEQPPLEESESDVDMSNWLNCRRLDFVPVSPPFPRSAGSHRGANDNASS
jgi:hypothetical protein